MPDSPANPSDLAAILNERQKHHGPRHAVMNEVDAAIRGEFPSEYEKLFTPGEIKVQLKTIRTADDGLTKLVSKVFPILVNPLGKRDSDKARAAAEKVEQIAYGWNDGASQRGGPEMDGIMFQLARHQVRFGDGCLIAYPDYERKLIFFDVKDPRAHYPPVGWHPWSQKPLDGTIIAYTQTLGEVKRTFAYDSDGHARSDVLARLNNLFASRYGYGGNSQIDDSQLVNVVTYYSCKTWMVACTGSGLDGSVTLLETGEGDYGFPGVCPVTSFMQFESEPLFAGQIGIEAAATKVLQQQIENTDRINRAPIFGPPIIGDEIRWGGYNQINMPMLGGASQQVQRIAPDSPNNLMNVLGQLLSLAQHYNYNPPSFQGEGEANSGKALQTLQAGPRALVTDILWAPFKTGFPRAYDNCLEMELNLWPLEKKNVVARKGKQVFEVTYTPQVDLVGYKGRIKIEEGFGLGGYSQTLEGLQMHQAGLMPRRMFLEMYPGIRDAAATERALDSEKVGQWMESLLEAKGPNLTIEGIVRIRDLLDQGNSLFDAIKQANSEGVLEPPPLPPEGGPGAEMPTLPPGLAQALAGAGLEQEMPALPQARGF